jgi:hypothetical protein
MIRSMIAFYLLGNIPIYLYSLLMGFGVFIGLAWVARRSSPEAIWRNVEAGLWALACGLLGGRAAYVALVWPYYQEHLLEAFQIHLGGLAWFGALGGGLFGLGLFARLNRLSAAQLADELLPLLTSISAASWAGCVAERCGYDVTAFTEQGAVSSLAWREAARAAIQQLFGASLGLGLLWLVDRLPAILDAWPGVRFSLGVFGLALALFSTALLNRAPPYWRGLPLDAWAALAFAALALAGAGLALLKGSRRDPLQGGSQQ